MLSRAVRGPALRRAIHYGLKTGARHIAAVTSSSEKASGELKSPNTDRIRALCERSLRFFVLNSKLRFMDKNGLDKDPDGNTSVSLMKEQARIINAAKDCVAKIPNSDIETFFSSGDIGAEASQD